VNNFLDFFLKNNNEYNGQFDYHKTHLWGEWLWCMRKSLCTVHKSQHNCFLHPQKTLRKICMSAKMVKADIKLYQKQTEETVSSSYHDLIFVSLPLSRINMFNGLYWHLFILILLFASVVSMHFDHLLEKYLTNFVLQHAPIILTFHLQHKLVSAATLIHVLLLSTCFSVKK